MTTTVTLPQRATLAQWLAYQQHVHALGVDLGLERVSEVWRRLGAPRIADVVVAVGGTNGKGSTVAFLEAILVAGGKRVGCFTSPHLLRYNERVRVAARDVDDAALIDAFERIEQARHSDPGAVVPLTYFEFGTLAALWVFAHSALDVAVLEVGLGGRLDAVNIIDADAAVVTTIDLDHQDWLGDSRDAIAREKAGIFRALAPAVIGDPDAPPALIDAARAIGAVPIIAGRDYFVESGSSADWVLRFAAGGHALVVAEPTLAAPVQRANAAAAIVALRALQERIRLPIDAISRGVRAAHVAARLQQFALRGGYALVIDVAHNPQAARVLAQWLARHPARGLNRFVFGALADKDAAGICAALAGHAATWHLGGLAGDSPRGLSAAALADRIAAQVGAGVSMHVDVAAALDAAAQEGVAGDRIVAFGSFFVAAAALGWAATRGET
ncbi:MAG: folylpolyglutamate synthase/dihydrofolate synthase family protein [Rudaea sp.]